MADVWLAEDTHLQRQVALKVLHRRFAQDQRVRRALPARGRGGRRAAAPEHRRRLRPRRGRRHLLHRDAVRRGADAEGADRPRADAPSRRWRWSARCSRAPRFAHRNGIVHRDLKPQNVIVDDEGKAVVTDFGIARAGVSEITQTGSVMGTPHYLSPEQAQGFEVTAVSDLYSIGVILYEALTGRVPFEGESAVAVAMKQVSQTPQRPSSINPQVSPALDAVVMRALEKEPGAALPERRRLHRRPRRGDARNRAAARRHGRLRAAAAGRRACRRGGCRGGGPQAQRLALGAAGRGDRDRHPVGLALTRDTTTEVPNVTGNAAQRRDRPARAEGLRGRRRSSGSSAQAPAEHSARAGPAASPPADRPTKTAPSSPSSARSRR